MASRRRQLTEAKPDSNDMISNDLLSVNWNTSALDYAQTIPIESFPTDESIYETWLNVFRWEFVFMGLMITI